MLQRFFTDPNFWIAVGVLASNAIFILLWYFERGTSRAHRAMIHNLVDTLHEQERKTQHYVLMYEAAQAALDRLQKKPAAGEEEQSG